MTYLLFLAMLLGQVCTTLDNTKYCFSRLPHCVPDWPGVVINEHGILSSSEMAGCSADDSVTIKKINPEPEDVPAVKGKESISTPCAWRDGDMGSCSFIIQWREGGSSCIFSATLADFDRYEQLPSCTTKNSWSCADKSRILLTAEDGKKWCHKVHP